MTTQKPNLSKQFRTLCCAGFNSNGLLCSLWTREDLADPDAVSSGFPCGATAAWPAAFFPQWTSSCCFRSVPLFVWNRNNMCRVSVSLMDSASDILCRCRNWQQDFTKTFSFSKRPIAWDWDKLGSDFSFSHKNLPELKKRRRKRREGTSHVPLCFWCFCLPLPTCWCPWTV